MKTEKLTKAQCQYILTLIDKDFSIHKSNLSRTEKYIEATKTSDPYFQRDVKTTNKKIHFAALCKEKIISLTK